MKWQVYRFLLFAQTSKEGFGHLWSVDLWWKLRMAGNNVITATGCKQNSYFSKCFNHEYIPASQALIAATLDGKSHHQDRQPESQTDEFSSVSDVRWQVNIFLLFAQTSKEGFGHLWSLDLWWKLRMAGNNVITAAGLNISHSSFCRKKNNNTYQVHRLGSPSLLIALMDAAPSLQQDVHPESDTD